MKMNELFVSKAIYYNNFWKFFRELLICYRGIVRLRRKRQTNISSFKRKNRAIEQRAENRAIEQRAENRAIVEQVKDLSD